MGWGSTVLIHSGGKNCQPPAQRANGALILAATKLLVATAFLYLPSVTLQHHEKHQTLYFQHTNQPPYFIHSVEFSRLAGQILPVRLGSRFARNSVQPLRHNRQIGMFRYQLLDFFEKTESLWRALSWNWSAFHLYSSNTCLPRTLTKHLVAERWALRLENFKFASKRNKSVENHICCAWSSFLLVLTGLLVLGYPGFQSCQNGTTGDHGSMHLTTHSDRST